MRRLLTTVAAATAFAVAGCSDATGLGNLEGSYELRTINGQSLPVTFNDPDFGAVTIVAGEVDIDDDGTFLDTIQFRFSGSSLIETEQVFGTWDIDGDIITFFPDDGGSYEMERTSRNRLVQTDFESGLTLVYQR